MLYSSPRIPWHEINENDIHQANQSISFLRFWILEFVVFLDRRFRMEYWVPHFCISTRDTRSWIPPELNPGHCPPWPQIPVEKLPAPWIGKACRSSFRRVGSRSILSNEDVEISFFLCRLYKSHSLNYKSLSWPWLNPKMLLFRNKNHREVECPLKVRLSITYIENRVRNLLLDSVLLWRCCVILFPEKVLCF